MDPDLLGPLCGLGCPALLLFMGLTVGTTVERRHKRRLSLREEELSGMLVTDLRTFPPDTDASANARLVFGEAVIAADYLKTFLARIRKIFGGEMHSYLSLMERARREAILRMLEQAQEFGYDSVCNVRLETSNIGMAQGRRGAAMVEVSAFGTAYRRSGAAL